MWGLAVVEVLLGWRCVLMEEDSWKPLCVEGRGYGA